MALPPITVQLSKFEQLEILRLETEAREEELRGLETKIRDILYDVEKRRYLHSLHPIFQELEPHAEMVNYQTLVQRRQALDEALGNLKATTQQLEAETAGLTRPTNSLPPGGLRALQASQPGSSGAAGAAAPRRKFDSFDDFRATKGGQ